MEKMREEFEVWVLLEAERSGYAYIDKVLSKFGESYTTTWVDSAWQGWKSSRAALCVELPENCKGMALTVDEFQRQLGKAGISYKQPK